MALGTQGILEGLQLQGGQGVGQPFPLHPLDLEGLGTLGFQESLHFLFHQWDQWNRFLEAQEGRCHHDCRGSQLLRGDLDLLSILPNPGSLWVQEVLGGHLFLGFPLFLACLVVLENLGLLCHL